MCTAQGPHASVVFHKQFAQVKLVMIIASYPGSFLRACMGTRLVMITIAQILYVTLGSDVKGTARALRAIKLKCDLTHPRKVL